MFAARPITYTNTIFSTVRRIGSKAKSTASKCAFVVDTTTLSDEGVHFNHDLDLRLKRECQSKFEETHSRDEFMKIIGKNYLD